MSIEWLWEYDSDMDVWMCGGPLDSSAAMSCEEGKWHLSLFMRGNFSQRGPFDSFEEAQAAAESALRLLVED
jgi:hypothetical protein